MIQQSAGMDNPMEMPVSAVFDTTGQKLLNGIANIELLCSGITFKPVFSTALVSLLPKIARFINKPAVGSAVITLLSEASLSSPLSVSHTSCLANAVVCHLIATMESEDDNHKITTAGRCSTILNQLAKSSSGHTIILRLLIEAVFRPEWAHVF